MMRSEIKQKTRVYVPRKRVFEHDKNEIFFETPQGHLFQIFFSKTPAISPRGVPPKTPQPPVFEKSNPRLMPGLDPQFDFNHTNKHVYRLMFSEPLNSY